MLFIALGPNYNVLGNPKSILLFEKKTSKIQFKMYIFILKKNNKMLTLKEVLKY